MRWLCGHNKVDTGGSRREALWGISGLLRARSSPNHREAKINGGTRSGYLIGEADMSTGNLQHVTTVNMQDNRELVEMDNLKAVGQRKLQKPVYVWADSWNMEEESGKKWGIPDRGQGLRQDP